MKAETNKLKRNGARRLLKGLAGLGRSVMELREVDSSLVSMQAQMGGHRETSLVPSEVNHPQHYNGHPSGVECITVVEEEKLAEARCRFLQMVMAIAPACREELEAEVQRRLEVSRKISERKPGQPMNMARAYESVMEDLKTGRL